MTEPAKPLSAEFVLSCCAAVSKVRKLSRYREWLMTFAELFDEQYETVGKGAESFAEHMHHGTTPVYRGFLPDGYPGVMLQYDRGRVFALVNSIAEGTVSLPLNAVPEDFSSLKVGTQLQQDNEERFPVRVSEAGNLNRLLAEASRMLHRHNMISDDTLSENLLFISLQENPCSP